MHLPLRVSTDNENNCVHFYDSDKRPKFRVTRSTKTPKKNYSPCLNLEKNECLVLLTISVHTVSVVLLSGVYPFEQ